MAALRNHLIANEINDAQRIVHTLKGLTATLGFQELYQHAQLLELAIKTPASNAEIMAAINAVEALLTPALAAIENHLNEDIAASAKPELNLQKTRHVLMQLEELLAKDDTLVNTLWREYASLIQASLGDVAVQLGKEIERFEYENALNTLRSIDLPD
jgi:HPt (histidine-containing phosphotransfer) domain-containing protein